MEILELLKTARDQMYLEDLEFFQTELDTGGYTDAYIAECRQQIELVRKWLCGEENTNVSQTEKSDAPAKRPKASLIMDIQGVAPEAANPVAAAMSPEKTILSDLRSVREHNSYKSQFKKYIQSHAEIDAAFVDSHYSFFLPWELNAIVSVKQLGEAFLEKYFSALDKQKISRYQYFSESFFMKHYSQLDTEIVLTKGKNDWRKKEKRSTQLDVFLRLKGVRL